MNPTNEGRWPGRPGRVQAAHERIDRAWKAAGDHVASAARATRGWLRAYGSPETRRGPRHAHAFDITMILGLGGIFALEPHSTFLGCLLGGAYVTILCRIGRRTMFLRGQTKARTEAIEQSEALLKQMDGQVRDVVRSFVEEGAIAPDDLPPALKRIFMEREI